MSNEIKNGIKKAPKQFQEFLKDYIKEIRKSPTKTGVIRDSTVYKYLIDVRAYLEINCQTIEDITSDSIINHIIDKSKRGQLLNTFRRMVLIGIKNNYLDKAILKELKEIKLTDKIPLPVTDPELEKKWVIPYERWNELYNKVSKGEDNILFTCWLGLNFGLRTGELANLPITNIRLKDRGDSYLTIQPVDSEFDYWEPKTIYSIRDIYITDSQERTITNFLDNREKLFNEYFPGQKHGFLLYSNQKGQRVKPPTIANWLTKLTLPFKELGKTFLRTVRPHVLRYSAAMHLYNETLNIYAVSKYLGHNSVTVTEKYLALTKAQRFDVIKNAMIKARL